MLTLLYVDLTNESIQLKLVFFHNTLLHASYVNNIIPQVKRKNKQKNKTAKNK